MTKRPQSRSLPGNVRDAALGILLAVSRDQAYSNLLLHRAIEADRIEPQDRSLLTELTYGTLQRRLTLDYFLAPFLKSEPEGWVRELLRLSVYQLVYLDRVPAHAVVNEAVEIAKRRGHRGIASMVNGVLRSVVREGVRPLTAIADPVERLAIETSHPRWITERLIEQYGREAAAEAMALNNEPPLQSLRVNERKADRSEVLAQLQSAGIEARPSDFLPEAILVRGAQVAKLPAYVQGLVSIQDESSMIPAYALKLKSGMRVLDMCAAPGGKATHIAEKLGDGGSVEALDLHPHKIQLIDQQAQRLGLTSIRATAMDAKRAADAWPPGTFDRVLVDAPCSGLGVIRRKPDIKYAKSAVDSRALRGVQAAILEQAACLLKPGGLLVYSTCSIDRAENSDVMALFMADHPEFQPEPLAEALPTSLRSLVNGAELQLLPQHIGSDGFFVAAARKALPS